jgi:hypothetical protein
MGDTVESVPGTIPYEKPRAVDPDQKLFYYAYRFLASRLIQNGPVFFGSK